jgi:hypothetical protein
MKSFLYWVGARESDIVHTNDIYAGSITLFGSNKNENIAFSSKYKVRTNHNLYNKDHIEFYESEVLKIINRDKNAFFMFYNPYLAYLMDTRIQGKTVCLNDRSLLNLLRDKICSRLWLSSIVPTIQNIQLSGKEVNFWDLQKYFPNTDSFVIQASFSSGGFGTWKLQKNNEKDVIIQLDNHSLYSVSPYLHNNIPVNIHCVIYENDILLLSPSIQIIEEEKHLLIYKGADYIAYNEIDAYSQNAIEQYSKKICEKLQKQGYRGVCGIDFIIFKDEIYFVEVNERFQASTFLLNYALNENQTPSVNELCLEAFKHVKTTCEKYRHQVPYSSYTYSQSDNPFFNINILKKYKNEPYVKEVLMDGYNIEQSCECDAYLFRIVLTRNICSINSEQGLNFNENISENKFIEYSLDSSLKTIQLKIALLNQGINLTAQALKYLLTKGELREANFSSLDLNISNSIIVNCPYQLNFSELSPFSINYENKKLILLHYQEEISEVELEMESLLNKKKTKLGTAFSSVSFLANDRVRLNYVSACYYKKYKMGCKFCNLPEGGAIIRLSDLFEVIDTYLKEGDFNHFLIGGGSESPDCNFEKILQIISHIRAKSKKSIYLMSLPPSDINILDQLYEAGLNEIAFNIEIFDRELANKIMPGKGRISIDRYLGALRHAVNLWGSQGAVRSLAILGLEKENTFLQGIETLCKIGVQPIISILRPMPYTPLANKINPSNECCKRIFDKALCICKKYNQILGPNCVYCQNNTLSLPAEDLKEYKILSL